MKVQETDEGYVVTGNKCKRGFTYGVNELLRPVRILTTTVPIAGGRERVLPVKTDKPVPKDKIFLLMDEINKIRLTAPVMLGETIVKNILGTGSNLIATREIVKTSGGDSDG
jgi:CxxC motif-containing protein